MPKDNNKDNSPFSINHLPLMETFVIFKTESGKVSIDVFYQDKTLWLTQKTIAELFEKGRSTITEHLEKYSKMPNPIAIGRMKFQYVGISDTFPKLENTQYINN